MNKLKQSIRIGDTVNVKKTILCPDFDIRIDGWRGTVIRKCNTSTESLVCILWNEATIKNMPKTFINDSIEKKLDYSCMYLNITKLELF